MRILSLSALFIFFITGCASTDQLTAQGTDSEFPRNAPEITDTHLFLAQLDELGSSLDAGSPRELTDAEWRKVSNLKAQLRDQLAGVDHIEALSPEEQERVNESARELWSTIADQTIANQRENRQPRCPQVRATGSRLARPGC